MKKLLLILVFISIILTTFSAQYSNTINQPDENGETPLVKAIYSENVGEIKGLIENKMDPNTFVNDNGQTLLMWACQNNNLELVKYLIGKGANVNLLDGDKENILVYCSDKPEIIKVLLNAGLNPKSTDEKDRTILDIAIRSEDEELAKLAILKKAFNLNGEKILQYRI